MVWMKVTFISGRQLELKVPDSADLKPETYVKFFSDTLNEDTRAIECGTFVFMIDQIESIQFMNGPAAE